MRSVVKSSVVFALVGPLMVPLWFMIWDSLGQYGSFRLPSLGGFIASAMLFYIFGIIPAFLTGMVSAVLYINLVNLNKWFVVIVSIIATVIAGGVLSAILVYCISNIVFSSSYSEPFKLAELAAIMGAVSSLICSLIVAYVYIRTENRPWVA